MWCLWSRLLWHYRSFINTNVSGSKSETSVPPAIRFLFLHFTCFIVENVFSHVCISKHIFIAKSFSLGNLSLLTNFQKLQRFDLNPIY